MTPRGFSVTDETLERATRVKRLIGRPQESTQSERRSTSRFEKSLYFLICHLDFIDIIVFQHYETSFSSLLFLSIHRNRIPVFIVMTNQPE